jgi:ankyrin repeat protein
MNDPYFDAIKSGDAAMVTRLLDADATLLSARSGNVSAVLLALYYGHAAIARLLVDRGAVLSFAEACAMGDERRAMELLADDATLLDRRSDDGFPPLGLAIFFRQPALARTLIERGADVNAAAENAQRVAPLHAAAAVQDRDTARLLLERGADPNARQQGDYTPLHGAASRGDVELGELLLRHGADRDARGSDGKSAADVARDRGHAPFAEWVESRD